MPYVNSDSMLKKYYVKTVQYGKAEKREDTAVLVVRNIEIELRKAET
jgi:hypothetical protein